MERIKKSDLYHNMNFYIDKRNIERLSKNAIRIDLADIEVGKILRDVSYRGGGIVNLKDTYVYAYLADLQNGRRLYEEYCRICNVPFRSEKEYDKLIKSLESHEYDIMKGAICINQYNQIIDGQYRACVLLKKIWSFL